MISKHEQQLEPESIDQNEKAKLHKIKLNVHKKLLMKS